MHWIFEVAKWTHVAAGVAALLIAPIAMLVQKGGPAHRRWGKIYFWAMALIFVTALVMLVFKPVIFLLAVAVLSFYAVLTGSRVLYRKRPERQPATMLDWAASLIALVVGIALIGWGGLFLLRGQTSMSFFPLLGVGFGVAISWNAIGDVHMYRRPPADERAWWYEHMQRMLSSYIGLVTAFLVQTVGPRLVDAGFPASQIWIIWVAPAVVGGYLIGRWIKAYRRRFSSHERAPAQQPGGAAKRA
jgi:hypothetical protein